jgi:hypothetical protein
MNRRAIVAIASAAAAALALSGQGAPALAAPRVFAPPPPLVRPHAAPPPAMHRVVITRPKPALPPASVFVPVYFPWYPASFGSPGFAGLAQQSGTCSSQQGTTLGDLLGTGGDPFFAPLTFGTQPGAAMTELPTALQTMLPYTNANAFCGTSSLQDLTNLTLGD